MTERLDSQSPADKPREPTPRTDDRALRFSLSAGEKSVGIPIDGTWVHADFARQLERELAQAVLDLETGFMQGAYARLKNLQEAERELSFQRLVEGPKFPDECSAGGNLGEPRSASVASVAAVTQCLTAGASNAVTTGNPLVCAHCGGAMFLPMSQFQYEFHDAEYPRDHPDRCTKRDAMVRELEKQGKQSWWCSKRVAHDSTRGGKHCSTHRDCGARTGRGICGREPLHDDGIHEKENATDAPADSRAEP